MNPRIPINEIKRLADDIRLIRDFSENHNFDASLINATIEPKTNERKLWDWPLACASIFTILIFIGLASISFITDIAAPVSKFIFLLCLLFAGIISICIHKRFENLTITIITGSVLCIVILIGAGVFTPKEAVEELQKIGHE